MEGEHHHHGLFYHKDQVLPINTKLNLVAIGEQGGGLRGVDSISSMTTFVNILLLILP
jgi:hypothetical protein